jgi:type VI secretion system Hcp family effector
MAYEFFLSVEGATQGKFDKEVQRKTRHAGKMSCISFKHEIDAPKDAAHGQASGMRRHGEVEIVKEFGPCTPMFMQALVQNETLSEVVLEFEKTVEGKLEVYYTVTLKEAQVSKIQYSTGGDDSAQSVKGSAKTDTHELERISFTYSEITIAHIQGSTEATDRWSDN